MITIPHISDAEMESNQRLIEAVETACGRIAPLWPLKNFVAVNPFLGMSDQDSTEAIDHLERVVHDRVLPDPGEFLDAFGRGEIADDDLQESRDRFGDSRSVDELKRALQQPGRDRWDILTAADAIDRQSGSSWANLVTEEVSKWCAAYFDQGQALWRMPWTGLPLFRAWKRGAERDRTPEVMGVTNFRQSVRALPDDALLAIQIVVNKLNVPNDALCDYLHRALMSVRGWAGYVQYLVREKSLRGEPDDSLTHLLAIRLAYDLAVAGPRFVWPTRGHHPAPPTDSARFIWQEAREIAHLRGLIAALREPTPTPPRETRPDVQAVFCIDVRSEVFRRALESSGPDIETIGFAGFFGFPVDVVAAGESSATARCPVLLVPNETVHESPRKGLALRNALSGVWKTLKSASLSCFPFVESFGLGYAATLVRDSLGAGRTKADADYDFRGIPLGTRVTLAEGALRNMGLTSHFARVVLLCGHGSASTNNPFASSLDCGACGGHAGDANSRLAATVLNNPAVREGLASRGIAIPDDTVFVAGLHNTTTDEVKLFHDEPTPSSHVGDIATLKATLKLAATAARQERAPKLGVTRAIDPAILRRARDWAEVRPEWGLANNHAFIAAPRARTRHLRLDGRVFLHSYDHANDPDDTILELLLCAPVVVASWINLQYFASAANNAAFGSGNKVLHNVVGKLGVLEGNGGDLRAGLPWQSVHDGTHPAHTPLRLSVLIEAPTDRIDTVLAKHADIAALVQNRWLHLLAIHPQTGDILRRVPGGGWVRPTRSN